ncbi:hypothetical protein E2C01_029199 [Portunus trituberculatus]|uniref:Uncharacterized protein n=1 Tax=Portunus trituberculatus TaxID=210409 RepID=A0A5B7EU03_PORTR|nr:hypothetical protein [Portunus trituberculatus]
MTTRYLIRYNNDKELSLTRHATGSRTSTIYVNSRLHYLIHQMPPATQIRSCRNSWQVFRRAEVLTRPKQPRLPKASHSHRRPQPASET